MKTSIIMNQHKTISARIALISDMHTVQKGKTKRMLSEAFDAIRGQGAELVISAGDNTNGCQAGEFDILCESIKNHFCDIPFYFAFGNHDYFSNNPDDVPNEKARDDFFNQMLIQNDSVNRFQNGTYSIRFNDIQIIFLDCIQSNRNFRFDKEQAKWLESELEESRNDRFRIVVNHLPLAAHVLGRKKIVKEFMAGNSKLQKIIDRYSNIIYISGHTHNRIDSDYPSAEQDKQGNIYLNAGSIGNTQPCLLDTKRLKSLRDSLPKDSDEYKEINRYFQMASMGLFMDIYEECITIKGYDFSQKRFIPRCDFVFTV